MPVGAALGPVLGAAAGASAHLADPSVGLPSPADPGSGGLRARDRGAGAWLGVRADRQPRLLGSDDPPSAEGVGGGRAERAGPHAGAAGVRPDDRPGAGRPGGGRLHHQGAGRRRGRRPLAGGSGQAGAQALGRDRWARHPAAPGRGRCQSARQPLARPDPRRPRQARRAARGRDRPPRPRLRRPADPRLARRRSASTAPSPARACRPRSRPARAGSWSARTAG